MGFSSRGITDADILAAITNDSTKWDGADLDAAISTAKAPTTLRFFSPALNISATGAQVDTALPSVTVPNLSGMSTIKWVNGGVNLFGIDTSSALNILNGSTQLQADTGSAGWINALELKDSRFGAPADGVCYGEFVGYLDIAAKVAFNQTTDFQLHDLRVTANNLDMQAITFVEIIM